MARDIFLSCPSHPSLPYGSPATTGGDRTRETGMHHESPFHTALDTICRLAAGQRVDPHAFTYLLEWDEHTLDHWLEELAREPGGPISSLLLLRDPWHRRSRSWFEELVVFIRERPELGIAVTFETLVPGIQANQGPRYIDAAMLEPCINRLKPEKAKRELGRYKHGLKKLGTNVGLARQAVDSLAKYRELLRAHTSRQSSLHKAYGEFQDLCARLEVMDCAPQDPNELETIAGYFESLFAIRFPTDVGSDDARAALAKYWGVTKSLIALARDT
jgi:hypothetical protein